MDIIIDGPQRLECAVVTEKEFGNAECGMPTTPLHRHWTYGVLRNRGKSIVVVEGVGCAGRLRMVVTLRIDGGNIVRDCGNDSKR